MCLCFNIYLVSEYKINININIGLYFKLYLNRYYVNCFHTLNKSSKSDE